MRETGDLNMGRGHGIVGTTATDVWTVIRSFGQDGRAGLAQALALFNSMCFGIYLPLGPKMKLYLPFAQVPAV